MKLTLLLILLVMTLGSSCKKSDSQASRSSSGNFTLQGDTN